MHPQEQTARHEAAAAYTAAANTGADPTTCLDAALDAAFKELFGELVEVTPQYAAFELGRLSGHPRYAGGEWKRLLRDSLEHATAAACGRYAADPERLRDIYTFRDVLHRYQTDPTVPRVTV